MKKGRGDMKLNLSFWFLIVVITLVCQSACRSRRVFTDHVQTVDFLEFNKFAWLELEGDTIEGLSLYDGQLLIQQVREQVEAELLSRGLVLDTVDPDLLVLVHTALEEREDLLMEPYIGAYRFRQPGRIVGPYNPFFYQSFESEPGFLEDGIIIDEYADGRIIVDVIGVEYNNIIWRGWAEHRLDIAPEEYRRIMLENVERMFRNFPMPVIDGE